MVAPRKSESTDEEFYATLTRLLSETVLNVAINKSILSSLFNFISETFQDEEIIKKLNKRQCSATGRRKTLPMRV